MNDSSVNKLLRALRRRRDEAQLTQLLAAFASTDRAFASGLVRSWLEVAPRDDAIKALGSIPDELDCEAEHHAFDDRGADRGFVDLRFFSEEEDFTLFVELKLHSGYGDAQLERYRAALDPLKGSSALLAMTTWLPRYGEDVVADDPRWIGSGRWSHAFAGMRALQHRNETLGLLWIELLDLLREQGDFGIMDIDKAAIEGWARWKTGRSQLTSLLEEIHGPTLSLLRQELAQRWGATDLEGVANEIRHNGKRLVWPWGESLHIEYAVPASNGERFRIQFVGGQEHLLFTVEARHQDNHVLNGCPEALQDATEKLRVSGFTAGHYWGAYWARAHRTDEWSQDHQAADALMRLVEHDVRALVESGIFDALAQVPDEGPREIPADAEDPDA